MDPGSVFEELFWQISKKCCFDASLLQRTICCSENSEMLQRYKIWIRKERSGEWAKMHRIYSSVCSLLKMVIRSICPTLKGSNKTKFCTQNALDNIVIHLCVAIYPLKSFEFLSQKFSSALHNYDEEGFCAKLVKFRIVLAGYNYFFGKSLEWIKWIGIWNWISDIWLPSPCWCCYTSSTFSFLKNL